MSVQQDYAFGQRRFVYVLLTYIMSTKISLSLFSALLLEFNPLIMNDVYRRHPTATSWGNSHLEWVVGPPWSRGTDEGYVVAPGKTAGTRSPAAPCTRFVHIPASESLLFLFPSQKGQILAGFRKIGQTHVLVTEWMWSAVIRSADVYSTVLSSLVKQPCCIVPEWYLVHVPSYGGINWLKHKEIETLGIKGLSTSHVHG